MTAKRPRKAPAKAGATKLGSVEIARFAERVHHWIDHAPDDADLLINLYRECVEVGETHDAPDVVDAARRLLFYGGISPQDGRTQGAIKLYKRRLVQSIAAMNDKALARDSARQAGTRKPRETVPGLQDWIAKQVQRRTGETAHDLWNRAPEVFTEAIGFDRFRKRVSRARKEAGLGRK